MMLGGGLHFTSSSGLTTLKNSVIQNNLADRGAGIYTAGNLHLEDVIIKGNTALENGGGIYSESDLTVRKSSIESNAALLGGGIYTTGTALAVSLDSDTIITGNTATDAGGGVVLCGDCNLDNGTISENEADIGGGLYLDWTTAPGAASHTVSGCMIKENIAQSAGGGMFINGSVDLQGTTVDNNSVTNTLTGEGGGIYQDSGALVLSGGSVIQRNSAAFGAGLYAIGSAIDGGKFEANQASDSGGGIYIGGEFGTSLARVTIRDNSATNRGGGLFSSSYMKSVDAEIISNTANQGGAIYADAEAALMTFDSASILSNTATTGGAIFLENGLVTLLLCDLGEGSTENIADDVYIGNIYGQSYTGYSTNTVVNCDTSIGSCL
jgi:predicted outer membrane repeat protein